MFQINAIASAAMNTLPLLGGHATALVMLATVGGLSREGSLSVMALDQLGEGIAKVTLFLIVAFTAPIPDWMRAGIATAYVGVAVLFIVLLTSAHFSHARPRTGVYPERSEGPNRVFTFVADTARRLETLRSPSKALRALFFALGTKAAEFVGLLCVQHAFGVSLPLSSSALVLAAIILGSMVPVAPANLGTFEAGAVLAYRHLGLAPELATTLAITTHLCFLIPSVGIGYAIASAKHLRFWARRDSASLEFIPSAAREMIPNEVRNLGNNSERSEESQR
jgi:uncharacterized membrane protein YbhN (UPF0104 family)